MVWTGGKEGEKKVRKGLGVTCRVTFLPLQKNKGKIQWSKKKFLQGRGEGGRGKQLGSQQVRAKMWKLPVVQGGGEEKVKHGGQLRGGGHVKEVVTNREKAFKMAATTVQCGVVDEGGGRTKRQQKQETSEKFNLERKDLKNF